jgi:hypothetical protein
MGTDIAGWLEAEFRTQWVGIIYLTPLLGKNHQMINFLFGARIDNPELAIAGLRGLPEDMSSEVKKGWGGRPGYRTTWISLGEIEAIDWQQHQEELSDDWQRLFDIMKILAKDPNIQDLRLVVNFF